MTNKPIIMITGFYGAGNSGDEAMLQNFYAHIKGRKPTAQIVVATGKRGIWYAPDLHYSPLEDRAKLKECDLLVVGGGDLGVGYGWQFLPITKFVSHPMKAVMMGMTIAGNWMNESIRPAICEVLKLYDKIFLREESSYNNLKSLGVECEVFSDMAIDLPEEFIDFHKLEKHVVVVVREAHFKHEPRMLLAAQLILDKLYAGGYNVTLLPFAVEDAIIAEKVAKLVDHEVGLIDTRNPRQHKFIINRADYLISIGRYHPLVYATEQGIPSIGMTYPSFGGKIKYWMDYIGMGDFCFNFLDTDKFEPAWEKLTNKKNSDLAHKNLLKRHAELVRMNNDQFDKLVELLP